MVWGNMAPLNTGFPSPWCGCTSCPTQHPARDAFPRCGPAGGWSHSQEQPSPHASPSRSQVSPAAFSEEADICAEREGLAHDNRPGIFPSPTETSQRHSLPSWLPADPLNLAAKSPRAGGAAQTHWASFRAATKPPGSGDAPDKRLGGRCCRTRHRAPRTRSPSPPRAQGHVPVQPRADSHVEALRHRQRLPNDQRAKVSRGQRWKPTRHEPGEQRRGVGAAPQRFLQTTPKSQGVLCSPEVGAPRGP